VQPSGEEDLEVEEEAAAATRLGRRAPPPHGLRPREEEEEEAPPLSEKMLPEKATQLTCLRRRSPPAPHRLVLAKDGGTPDALVVEHGMEAQVA